MKMRLTFLPALYMMGASDKPRKDSRMVKFSRFAMVTGVMALGLLSVGCSSDKITAESVRSNPSPDLTSMALNDDQMKNRTARAIHTTERQIWDDIDAIMFWDRPMRMTKYPIR